jgi:hypothetical protein
MRIEMDLDGMKGGMEFDWGSLLSQLGQSIVRGSRVP